MQLAPPAPPRSNLGRDRDRRVADVEEPQRDAQPHADWAYRLMNAHNNAVENLVVFAPLALAVHALGISAPMTALACALYFWSRVAHAVVYAVGAPILRTIAFLIGFGAQARCFCTSSAWLRLA